mgnify:CR=1 FL=1
MKFWCQEANLIAHISLQMFSKRNIKTTESLRKVRVCKSINNMYLQLLCSAMGTSCGTKKYHKDKGFNFR